MDQSVMNYEVGLAEEMTDCGHVRGMSADKNKAVLCTNQISNFFLNLTMQTPFA